MGRVIQVRFTAEDTKGIAAAAKASKQTVSEWVRSTVHTIIYQCFPAYCPVCKENVTASIALNRIDLMEALERNAEVPLVHAFPLAPDHKFFMMKEQKEIVRKRIANGTF
jgi:ferredoxin